VKRLGFPEEAAQTIWHVLAAILHLGNMEFVAKVRAQLLQRCSNILVIFMSY
jgi:myosin heavy subunit